MTRSRDTASIIPTVDAKGDLLVGTADNAIDNLPAGTNGTYLKANSASATGLEWGTGVESIVDAKGDLLVGTADNTIDNLSPGTNGQVLTANSATTTGLQWAASDGVRVFADTAGRTAAIPSPTEGMTTYQLDTNFIDTYSGTAWVPTVSNNAWTFYTPTITVAAGAITTATTAGSFKVVGKVCHVKQSISIVNNGNAGGWIGLSLPLPATGGSSTGLYRENAATGAMGQILVGGTAIYFSSGNGYPGGNGFNILGSFFYEVA